MRRTAARLRTRASTRGTGWLAQVRRGWFERRLRLSAPRFHQLFYQAGTEYRAAWPDTRWLGARTFKSPLDLWVYQEILHEKRPDLVIETGTSHGGSALFLAHVLDQLQHGQIITVGIAAQAMPAHPRITYLPGSSTDAAVVAELQHRALGQQVMALLDSDHRAAHVLAELRIYADLVTPGQYLVVEDTNLNGHPVYKRFGPGPWEALGQFQRSDTRFVVDRRREKYLFTFNPGGFLLKVRP